MLMDSRRATGVLGVSLETVRELGARLSSLRPAPADAEELRSQNEVMVKVIEKLKEELRAANGEAECSCEIAEVKARYKKLALDANNELRAYKDFAKRIIRVAESVPGGAFEDEKA